MTLRQHVKELVDKFSFVKRTEFKNGCLYIFYDNVKGMERWKRLPLRANKDHLLNVIDSIRTEILYSENRKSIYEKTNKIINQKPEFEAI
jgi:hypothetical protein